MAILPAALPSTVSAQASYTIDQVDHNVEVLYSGNVVVLDTIHVSGQVTDGFTVALPYVYSADVLKVLAYDENNVYDVNVGVQLGDHSGFYGVAINFNGNSPSVFTVAFILSNSLTTDQGSGNFLVEFPAYPSLEQTVGTCNAQLTTPQAPTSISISKDDGNITTPVYSKSGLPAYTYSAAEANIQVSSGSIKSSVISSLNREISIDTTGTVNAVDTYRITSNASASMGSYVLSLPLEASNIDIRDSYGNALTTVIDTSSNLMLVNVTFSTSVSRGQAATLTVNYKLPGATLQGSQYVLSNFQLFANFQYVVQHATMTFHLPEGATITTPTANQLDSSSTLTRGTYQDTLTVRADEISSVDYLAPKENTIQLSYQYNPVWVSFMPTFWAAGLAVVGCIGAVVYRKRRPAYKAEPIIIGKPKRAPERPIYETVKGTQVTAMEIRDFTDAYEDKKQLRSELHALDIKAQKGKIPRRQYKVQKAALETRIDSLTRTLERHKAVFRGSVGTYPDLIKQLDVAESELEEAEENIGILEARQSKGEISIESYKKNIADAQKLRDRAESTINGILLRLREKIR